MGLVYEAQEGKERSGGEHHIGFGASSPPKSLQSSSCNGEEWGASQSPRQISTPRTYVYVFFSISLEPSDTLHSNSMNKMMPQWTVQVGDLGKREGYCEGVWCSG